MITTDKPFQIASRLLELGMATSVFVDAKDRNGIDSFGFKATESFDETKIIEIAKQVGADSSQVMVKKRQKTISELYMESLA